MYMGASAETNTTGHRLRQIKIPWQCRWWTFIYMVAFEKMVCKDSGPARLGSDRVGLATERVGNSGDSAGAWNKQGGL